MTTLYICKSNTYSYRQSGWHWSYAVLPEGQDVDKTGEVMTCHRAVNDQTPILM